MYIKNISLAFLGMFLISFASATITINTENNTYFGYYSNIPINFSSTHGTVEVYVSDDLTFDDNNLICEFSSSGSNICNFTAFKTGLYEDDCESFYQFGDGGSLLGDDIGTGNYDCVVQGTVTAIDNCGLIKDCGDFHSNGGLSCGDVRGTLLGGSVNWSMQSWSYLPEAYDGLNEAVTETNKIFYKNDDNPTYQIYPNGLVRPNLGDGDAGLNTGVNTISYNNWYHISYQHRDDDFTYVYVNGVLRDSNQGTSAYFPGASEYIGAEASGFRNFEGYIDEFQICSRLFNSTELEAMYTYKDGLYYFKINNSNGDEEVGYFYKDTIDPIIKIDSPFGVKKNYINVTVTDANNVSLFVYLDGTLLYNATKDSETQNYLNLTIPSTGEHNLTIIAEDIANNQITRQKIFDVSPSLSVNILNDTDTKLNILNSLKDTLIKLFGGKE